MYDIYKFAEISSHLSPKSIDFFFLCFSFYDDIIFG